MTLHTIETLMDWLSDESQFLQKTQKSYSYNGFDFLGIRKRFRLSNGKGVSIQQSALHYCTADTMELSQCPCSPLIEPYAPQKGGYGPYALVPLHVVVNYLNEQENL